MIRPTAHRWTTVALLGAAVGVLWLTSATAAAGGFPAPSGGPGRTAAAARRAASPVTSGSAAARATPAPAPAPSVRRALVRIPRGTYLPLYTAGGRTDLRVEVEAFELDARQVTRAEFAAFVATHPEWRRSAVPRELARTGYLADWRGDLAYGEAADANRPVTQVPLAAARAFCAAEGKRLPTTDEWEYAAAASPERRDASADDAFKQRLLDLYTRPRPAEPAPVGSIFRNAFGVWDLHGLVWEWTYQGHEGTESLETDTHPDGAHAAHAAHAAHGEKHGASGARRAGEMDDMPGMAHGDEHRGPGKHDMGCAGSAAGASDTRGYAAFLRYAFREAVAPTSVASSLGFRCAR